MLENLLSNWNQTWQLLGWDFVTSVYQLVQVHAWFIDRLTSPLKTIGFEIFKDIKIKSLTMEHLDEVFKCLKCIEGGVLHIQHLKPILKAVISSMKLIIFLQLYFSIIRD